jgi:transketolase
MRKTFADILIRKAEEDEKLVVLIGDISHFLLKEFESRFPDRFYNIGICEQSMIGIAAGLALNGFKPVVHTIAPFCVERAYEQIKIDLCYQELDVTIVTVGGSFDYAHLGCTHHCYSDISILRPLPNIDIFCPGNKKEFKNLFNKTWSNGKTKYFKLFKSMHEEDFDINPYDCHIIEGDITKPLIFTCGHTLEIVKEKQNIIIYLPTIEPLSLETELKIVNLLKKQNNCISVEENSSIGALGDKIFDIASRNNMLINLKKTGIPRKFCTDYGTADEHREILGLTKEKLRYV